LELTQDELNTVDLLQSGWETQDILEKETRQQQESTESAERKVASLRSMRMCRPLTLSSSQMDFAFLGPCPKACISTSCSVLPSGIVVIRAAIQPNLFLTTMKSRQPKSQNILKFIEAQAENFCSFLGSKELDHPSRIGSFLREAEWRYGRALETAAEIAIVGRRYKIILSPIEDEPSDFNLDVDFGCRFRAQFRLSNNRSTRCLQVDFQDAQDDENVVSIQKRIKHIVKPGFGCLARACDIISASLQ
jgi:hypothetical protein